jgi:hypothetical protein
MTVSWMPIQQIGRPEFRTRRKSCCRSSVLTPDRPEKSQLSDAWLSFLDQVARSIGITTSVRFLAGGLITIDAMRCQKVIQSSSEA